MSSDHPFTERITRTKAGLFAWHQERVIFEATELICHILERDGVSRGELSRMVEKSPGRVSQLLDGTANMTLRTASDLFTALGYELHPQAIRPVMAREHLTYAYQTPPAWRSPWSRVSINQIDSVSS